MPAETTTTTEPAAELIITGTGKVYTLEESQHFGEFGPLIWNLVTTLNGTDEIEHHPTYEWVIWGPMWGGRLNGSRPWREIFGVTDLDTVDPEAIAAAVPTGTVIVLREVRWSLDQLNDFLDSLRPEDIADDPIFCELSTSPETGLELVATVAQIEFLQSELPGVLGDLFEAVHFTMTDECHYATGWGPVIVSPRVLTDDYPPE